MMMMMMAGNWNRSIVDAPVYFHFNDFRARNICSRPEKANGVFNRHVGPYVLHRVAEGNLVVCWYKKEEHGKTGNII
jgi:hypothetical protein